MRDGFLVLAIAATAAGFAVLLTGGSVRVGAADVPVAVGDFYFCDQSLQGGVCETTVSAGDRVVWSVQSGSHTVTECDSAYTTCPPSGGFTSGSLSQNQQFDHTFSSAGTFYYYCAFHPQLMRGTVVVQAQATASPTPTPSPSPAPSATGAATASPTGTATPAAVPAAGGEPSGGGAGLPLELVVISATLAMAAGIFVVRLSGATRN